MKLKVGDRVAYRQFSGEVIRVYENEQEIDVRRDDKPEIHAYVPVEWCTRLKRTSEGGKAEVHAGPSWGVR